MLDFLRLEPGVAALVESKARSVDPKDTTAKPPFPKSLPEQTAAVREALADPGEATLEQIARSFEHGRAQTIGPFLESLTLRATSAPWKTGTLRCRGRDAIV